MCGLIIGAACLIGLFVTLRAGRRWRRGGCGSSGGGCGSGGGGGWRGRHQHGPWDGQTWFARAVADYVDATSEQRKVIEGAAAEIHAAADNARDELKRSRKDVAGAVRSSNFDEVLFGELFSRHDDTITAVRKAAMGALGRVHAVLDDAQRARLANAIEGGWGGFRGHR